MSSYHARIIKRLREVARRRGGFTHAQLAILEFHQTMEASGEGPSNALQPKARQTTEPTFQFPPMPKSQYSASEDERRARHTEMCGEVEDGAKFCPKCGVRLDEDDSERRGKADEGEGDDRSPRDSVKNRQDEKNDLRGSEGRSGKGAEAAVTAFNREIRRARESARGIQRDYVTGG